MSGRTSPSCCGLATVPKTYGGAETEWESALLSSGAAPAFHAAGLPVDEIDVRVTEGHDPPSGIGREIRDLFSPFVVAIGNGVARRAPRR